MPGSQGHGSVAGVRDPTTYGDGLGCSPAVSLSFPIPSLL